jgi:hypothetical protein
MIDVYRAVLSNCVSTLRFYSDADWNIPAIGIDMSVSGVGAHVADGLIAYAAQIVGQPSDHWVPIQVAIEQGADVFGLIEAISTAGRILDIVAVNSPATSRSYHSWGMSDPEGFLAMGCVELLAHTYDIVTSLEGEFSVDDKLVQPFLERLFRGVPTECSRWEALLWSTGRIAIPGSPRQESWRWYADV